MAERSLAERSAVSDPTRSTIGLYGALLSGPIRNDSMTSLTRDRFGVATSCMRQPAFLSDTSLPCSNSARKLFRSQYCVDPSAMNR